MVSTGEASEVLDDLPTGGIPEADLAIAAAGQKSCAVGRENESLDRASNRANAAKFSPGDRVPPADGPIVTRGND
jgi:hypothetical protein